MILVARRSTSLRSLPGLTIRLRVGTVSAGNTALEGSGHPSALVFPTSPQGMSVEASVSRSRGRIDPCIPLLNFQGPATCRKGCSCGSNASGQPFEFDELMELVESSRAETVKPTASGITDALLAPGGSSRPRAFDTNEEANGRSVARKSTAGTSASFLPEEDCLRLSPTLFSEGSSSRRQGITHPHSQGPAREP